MPLKATHSYLKNIAIFGAGGLGREVLMLIHQINQAIPTWQVLGFYDDNPEIPPRINEYPYLGTLADLQAVTEPLHVVLAIGDPKIKALLGEKLTNKNIHYPVLRHPDVSDEAFQFNNLGEGTVICQGCILTTNITLGKHVFLNLGCTVGHEAIIDNYSSLMPQVNIAGKVNLGPQVYVGTNATILQNLTVGASTIIGAGAIVIRDLPGKCTAVGIPAKIIKRHDG